MLRSRTLPVFAFPILLTIGIVLIPVVSDYGNHEIAVQAVAQSARWLAGHLISAAAFGLSVWAASEIMTGLRHRGSKPEHVPLLLISLGAALYAAGLGADGIAPVALTLSGSSPMTFFDGGIWVTGVFILATLLFGVGLIHLTVSAIRGGIVTGIWRYIVFGSALALMVVPAVPSGYGLFGEALAAFGVFLPIGFSMARSK
jgi:hypothetical protein